MAASVSQVTWVKAKKNVGLKAFFPELNNDMSTLEKARVWVKRHNNNYFVGWTEEQLGSVDPIVRPHRVISPELYKRHMNRSEFGRIVKLKFCMESDADWAKEFCQRLATSAADGGFKGLGEAKQSASDLWRKHSELYDAQRARQVSPLSPLRLRSPKPTVPKTVRKYHRVSKSSIRSPRGIKRSFNMKEEELLRDTGHSSGSDSGQAESVQVKEEDIEPPVLQPFPQEIPVFPKLENVEISIEEKVNILLERNRNDFFLNWNESQLESASEYARPYVTVDHNLYQQYVNSEDGLACSAITTIYVLQEPWAERFRQKISLSPNEGGFQSLSELKSAASKLLNIYINEDNYEMPDLSVSRQPEYDRDCSGPVIEYRGLQIRRGAGQGSVSSNQTLPDNADLNIKTAVNHTLPAQDCLPGYSDEVSRSVTYKKSKVFHSPQFIKPTSVITVEKVPDTSLHQTQALSVNSSSGFQSLRILSNSSRTASVSTEPSFIRQSYSGEGQELASHIPLNYPDIWQFRDELVKQCEQNPLLSWHDRLRPHLPTIRQALGETYTLPSTVAECIADLMLVTLQKCLTESR